MALPYLIWLSADVPRKAADGTYFFVPKWMTHRGLQVPGFSLAHATCCSHMEHEPAEGNLSLPLTLHFQNIHSSLEEKIKYLAEKSHFSNKLDQFPDYLG